MEIVIGNISIKSGGDGNLWLENRLGEGMSVREVELMKVLDKFFSDNF